MYVRLSFMDLRLFPSWLTQVHVLGGKELDATSDYQANRARGRVRMIQAH
jgi:hypothetical protein